jgi:hypothetical protein
MYLPQSSEDGSHLAFLASWRISHQLSGIKKGSKIDEKTLATSLSSLNQQMETA